MRRVGGVPRYVRLPAPHFRPDWDAVRRVATRRTPEEPTALRVVDVFFAAVVLAFLNGTDG